MFDRPEVKNVRVNFLIFSGWERNGERRRKEEKGGERRRKEEKGGERRRKEEKGGSGIIPIPRG
ncbi:hypothetical protein [Akkermansia biwaensis]|uniref:hypothetical protein n=1 Tax=Akkermansia biwaensis TaxID=2946555 RepID=UPI0022362B71|nr:hypothetical protein [Akkermansia biwaensis]